MNIRISTDIENQIYRHLQNPNEENEGKLFSIVRPALRDDIKRLKEVLNKIVTTGDQEVIIKELDKEKESIRRAYSSSQEKEDNESQELKSFRIELSVISLSENIAYLKTLTNKNPENYKKLINDSIKYLFQKFEEAYKESKCDTRIIGVIIGDYTHFLVRNLYTITHYEDYKTQIERSLDINTSVANAFENSQNVLLQATREKDETRKIELMREYESFNAEFNAHREELLILQNALYDESFQGVDINAKIEKFLKKLNPLENIPTAKKSFQSDIQRISIQPNSASYLNNSQAFIKSQAVLNQPYRVSSVNKEEITYREEYKTGNIVLNYKTKYNDITWTIPQELGNIENGVKLFNFFGKKVNENPAHDGVAPFILQELIDIGIYKNKDTAIYGLQNSINQMQKIIIRGTATEYAGKGEKNQVISASGPIVSWVTISRQRCEVTLAPIFKSGYIPITVITDPNFFKLSTKAHLLLSYIAAQYRMKQNARKIKKDGFFNISIEAIRIHLGLPTIEKTNGHPKQLIVDKIEEALAELSESAGKQGMKITVVSDYLEKINQTGSKQTRPSVASYLKGYLQIEVDEETRAIMTKRANEMELEIEKTGSRKEKALQRIADKIEARKSEK